MEVERFAKRDVIFGGVNAGAGFRDICRWDGEEAWANVVHYETQHRIVLHVCK